MNEQNLGLALSVVILVLQFLTHRKIRACGDKACKTAIQNATIPENATKQPLEAS